MQCLEYILNRSPISSHREEYSERYNGTDNAGNGDRLRASFYDRGRIARQARRRSRRGRYVKREHVDQRVHDLTKVRLHVRAEPA